MNYKKTPIKKVINLTAAKGVVKQRVINRGENDKRKDDNINAFNVRWGEYLSNTIPSLEYFKGRGKVVDVDSEKEISEVYDNIKLVIESI
jgi:UMP-CMP kinase